MSQLSLYQVISRPFSPPAPYAAGERPASVELLSQSIVQVGPTGRAHVVKEWTPTNDSFSVDTRGLVGAEAHVARRIGLGAAADPSQLAIVGSHAQAPAPAAAQLEHYITYQGVVLVDGEPLRLIGRDGDRVVGLDGLGAEVRFAPASARLVYSEDVAVPFVARRSSSLSYELAHVDGRGQVLVEADIAATANTVYKLVITGIEGETVTAQAFPELTFHNGTDRSLDDVELQLLLTQPAASPAPGFNAKSMVAESIRMAADVGPAVESTTGAVITKRVAEHFSVGPNETRMINFAGTPEQFLPMTLQNCLELEIDTYVPEEGGEVVREKLHPSNVFTLRDADERRPAATYMIFEGQQRIGATQTYRYTEVHDDVVIQAPPMRAVSVDTRVAGRLYEAQAWEVVGTQPASRMQFERRQASYDVEAQLDLRNTSEHRRVVTAVLDLSTWDDFASDAVQATIKHGNDGNDELVDASAIEVDARGKRVTIKVPLAAKDTPERADAALARLVFRAMRTESRSVPLAEPVTTVAVRAAEGLG